MVRVVITGVSLISCLGNTQNTWLSITQGISGIKITQPFDFLSPLPLGLINSQPSLLHDVTTQLITQLCQDADLLPPFHHTGVIIGSSRGFQSQWESFTHDNNLSLWLPTLPHQNALTVARFLQCDNFVSSPSNACATGLTAIAQGYELLQRGMYEKVVVGAVETPITPLTIVGFKQIKALASKGCYPFDINRQGLVLGEGGGMLLLETAESAFKRQGKIYGEILGWGMSCDAFAMTTPEKTGKTAIKAIEKCLQLAHILPEEIDYIHTHGTGTILNDQREAKIIQNLFPHQPKISSSKWATGHSLGASGAIAMVLNCLSLTQQKLIPNTPNINSNFDLNFCEKSDDYDLKKMLCFTFGFGGQNVIMALGKVIHSSTN